MEYEDYRSIDLHGCAQAFLDRAEIDYDAVVAITGEEGVSKSTCASGLILESLKIQKIPEDKLIETFLERTIFSPSKERVEAQIKNAPRYAFINADEAIKILYKLNWGTNIQKFLNMLYALARKENKITLLCMPRFTDFNEFFRKHRIKFWIHILDRGLGVMFAKDWNPFTDDPWWMQEGMKVVATNYGRRKVTDFNTQEKINILSKLRNFVGIIKFDDLPNDIRKIYKSEKDKYGYDDMEQSKDIGANARAIKYKDNLEIAAIRLKERGMTMLEIANILNMSTRTVGRYVNGKAQDTRTPQINKTSEVDNFVPLQKEFNNTTEKLNDKDDIQPTDK